MSILIFYGDAHQRDLAEVLAARLSGRESAQRAGSRATARSIFQQRIRGLARPVRQAWIRVRGLPPLSYIIALALYGYRRDRAHWTIKKVHPDVIVLFEDNIGNFTRLIGAAAARLGIPYVVMPTTIPNPREAASFFKWLKAHAVAGPLARFIARRWPQWVYDFEGQHMLRLPAADIMAMRCLGVDTARPWILNSGDAAAICAESTANRAIYERLGIDSRQLVTTGNLADDTLFEVSAKRLERRRALTAELGLDPARVLLVVAFPPNQFAAPSKAAFEYTSFAELLEGWLRALVPLAEYVDIVLRAHPRLDPLELDPFEAAGCHVFTGPTEELVPLADVFVASISATIRWALALGIPVVNYDCYRYRYDDYRGAAGMVLVEDQCSFASALRQICLDSSARETLREKQNLDRANWGCIDGGFSSRFRALLQGMSRQQDGSMSILIRPLPR